MIHWQEHMLDDLLSYFEPNHDVLGLALFGSFSRPERHPDYWSDIDILVVVTDGRIDDFFPDVEWMTRFGRLYTYSQSSDDFICITRACFENFDRIDFVITTEGKLADINSWSTVPFSSGVKVILSRSRIVDQIAVQTYHQQKRSSTTHEQFLDMVRDFRFKSMLAVYKVVRNDLLIALHLAQDLVRDCSELGMMLRDRSTGTNVHEYGGPGNQFVAQLEATQKPFTSIGLLDSIKASNEVFEKLAHEWSNSYQENRQLLLDWIEKAKVEISD